MGERNNLGKLLRPEAVTHNPSLTTHHPPYTPTGTLTNGISIASSAFSTTI
jgi:hypothetical protein